MSVTQECVKKIQEFQHMCACPPALLLLAPAKWTALENELGGQSTAGHAMVDGVNVYMSIYVTGVLAVGTPVNPSLPSQHATRSLVTGILRSFSRPYEIQPAFMTVMRTASKCTCGASTCGSSMHSSWCDIA